MIVPIFLPRSRSPRWDHVCPHCRQGFNEEWGWFSSCLMYVAAFGVVIFFMWAGVTLMHWAMPFGGGHRTLVEVLVSQWHWLTSLRVW